MTYVLKLLTALSRVLNKKLTGPQPVKKISDNYGNRMFITALTRARHLSQYLALLYDCSQKTRDLRFSQLQELSDMDSYLIMNISDVCPDVMYSKPEIKVLPKQLKEFAKVQYVIQTKTLIN